MTFYYEITFKTNKYKNVEINATTAEKARGKINVSFPAIKEFRLIEVKSNNY